MDKELKCGFKCYIGCNKKQEISKNANNVYKNEKFGLKFEVPSSWKSNYEAKQN